MLKGTYVDTTGFVWTSIATRVNAKVQLTVDRDDDCTESEISILKAKPQ